MTKAVLALFCMPGDGHFNLLRPLIHDLARAGFAVHVFADRRYGAAIENAGALAIDLFAKYPIETADGESIPVPCRNVTFAAVYADQIVAELKVLQPAIVFYETFAVIGWLAARLLGVPYINVQAGHNLHPSLYLPVLERDPRVAVSERCHRAVEVLRQRYGVIDASPFSYVTGLSPYLNIYCEPPEFLSLDERQRFEPVAFHGCIPSRPDADRPPGDAGRDFFGTSGLKIYVCFGTVALGYFPDAALGVFRAISQCLEAMPQARALICLGGAAIDDGILRRLRRPNVEIVDYVDQWAVLDQADVFVTHHGLNSTHEAIFQGVPMISYPFFGDQPALAEKSRHFGIAVPLAETVRGPVDQHDFAKALEAISGNRQSIEANLSRTKSWELEAMAHRPSTYARIADLANGGGPIS